MLCLLITCFPVDDSQQSTIFTPFLFLRFHHGQGVVRWSTWDLWAGVKVGQICFELGWFLACFATPGIPAVWAIRFEFFSSITWYIVTKYYMQILQNQYSLLYKFSGHDNEIKIMNKESIIDTLLFIESSLRSHSVSSRVSSHEIESPSNTT